MTIVWFLLKRLAGTFGLLLLVSLLVFGLLALTPGSLVATLLGTRPASADAVAAIESRYHLDEPVLVQYWYWLSGAVQGDLGRSTRSGEAVTSMIASYLPVTLELALYALLLAVLIGIPVGMAAGIRRGRPFDRAVSTLSIVGMSSPGFAVGLLLIYVFGVRLAWFPVYGAGEGTFVDRVAHLTLPAVALAIFLIALIVRQTRAAVMGVMDQDYVTFAQARGLSTRRVMICYALRNVALPVITAAGLLMIVAISATVLVETVFSLPGVGMLMVESIQAKDIPVVQGLALLVALLVVAVNLLVDTIAMIIDPRIRAGVRR